VLKQSVEAGWFDRIGVVFLPMAVRTDQVAFRYFGANVRFRTAGRDHLVHSRLFVRTIGMVEIKD
jgi:hypothetical protein